LKKNPLIYRDMYLKLILEV